MKLSHRTARKARQIFFFIHLWTGVVLGLWLVMIGLTGSVLAWPELIGAEMKWRFPYEKTSIYQQHISLSRALQSIKTAQPDITPQELSSVIIPTTRFPFYIFIRAHQPVDNALFLVDPYSGKVNTPLAVPDFWTGKIEYLHIFLLNGPKGLITNGVLSFFALFLLLSGLWLWWPSTLRQLILRLSIKRNAPLRRILMDLHNVLGIYLYAILFITTATAVLLVINSSTQQGIETALDGKTHSQPLTVQPQGTRLPDDVLLQRAHAAMPQAIFSYLTRPVKSTDPYVIHYERSGYGFLRAGSISLDPYTGKTLKIERDSQSSTGHKSMALIEDLHVGLYGGVWIKSLYTLAGLLPLGLFISGLLMWWKRKQASARVKAIRPTP